MGEKIQITVVGRRCRNFAATAEVLGKVELRTSEFVPEVLVQVVVTENGGEMTHSTTHYIIPTGATISELIIGRRRSLLKLKDGSTIKPASVSLTEEQKASLKYEPRCHGYFHRVWRK